MIEIMDQQMDVALIGAGPIGIEMAVALKQAGIDYRHFDAGQIGATIQWFPPATHFFSSPQRIAIAGVPLQTLDQGKATREDYLRYLRTVVLLHDLAINTYEPVGDIQTVNDGFVLTTHPNQTRRMWRARRIILATGGTAYPRRLGIPGEDLPHVSAYFHEPHVYFRRRVVIIGGRNSAVEAALRLHHTRAQVALSYRRSSFDDQRIKYWLLPEINNLITKKEITCWFDTVPVQITPEYVELAKVNEKLERLDQQTIKVPADHVLSLIGYEADMSLCRKVGVNLHGLDQQPQFDEQTMQTNVPGVYVAGTATGGTQQSFQVFLENCHIHVQRILASLQGRVQQATAPHYQEPES